MVLPQLMTVQTLQSRHIELIRMLFCFPTINLPHVKVTNKNTIKNQNPDLFDLNQACLI